MSVTFADCYSKSRQAFHQRRIFLDQRTAQSMLALDLVTAIRRETPRLGTKKLYLLLREPLQKSGIAMGRDRLHELLRGELRGEDQLSTYRRTRPMKAG